MSAYTHNHTETKAVCSSYFTTCNKIVFEQLAKTDTDSASQNQGLQACIETNTNRFQDGPLQSFHPNVTHTSLSASSFFFLSFHAFTFSSLRHSIFLLSLFPFHFPSSPVTSCSTAFIPLVSTKDNTLAVPQATNTSCIRTNSFQLHTSLTFGGTRYKDWKGQVHPVPKNKRCAAVITTSCRSCFKRLKS